LSRINQFAGRHRGLDAVQETDEFLVAVAGHALANHRAVEDIERGKQHGRARTFFKSSSSPFGSIVQKFGIGRINVQYAQQ
jgi:hypothetical protein